MYKKMNIGTKKKISLKQSFLQQNIIVRKSNLLFFYSFTSSSSICILYYLYLMEQKQQDFFKTNQYLPLSFGITPVNLHFNMSFFNFAPLHPITTQQIAQVPQSTSDVSNMKQQEMVDEGIQYFISFFSPKQTAKSLQKRNQNLEMLTFDFSDGQEPDDIYNRRKKKVSDLINQQKQQVKAILSIKKQSEEKYDAIIEFVKFFCILKQKLSNKRTDYYSSKTFCALKNASEVQLRNLKKVVQKIYINSINYPQTAEEGSQKILITQNQVNNRIIQFLIIPRFLISKQKINRLTKDEQLQRNFQFLIGNQCLGHYNNQANKKMPEENHMRYVRELLTKKLGREKFKKICSINHGNKFLKSHQAIYYSLYSQNLNYLQHLDNSLKKGKKFDVIKKQLQKIANQTQQTVGNSSNTENQSSSNGIYSFKNFGDCLNKIEKQEKDSKLKSEHLDQIQIQQPAQKVQLVMQKKKLKKFMSTPIQEQEPFVPIKGRFQVRKFNSMQQKVEQNIILIPPPSNQYI